MRDKTEKEGAKQPREKKKKKKFNLGSSLGNSFGSVSQPSLTNRKLKAQTHLFPSAC